MAAGIDDEGMRIPGMLLKPEIYKYMVAFGVTWLLASCAGIQQTQTGIGDEALPATLVERASGEWIETDAVVVLNNRELTEHIEVNLTDLETPEAFIFESVALDFAGGEITIVIQALLTDANNISHRASLQGNVFLSFSGTGLSWFPKLHQLTIEAPITDLNPDAWLDQINTVLIRRIVVARNNELGFSLPAADALTFNVTLSRTGDEGFSRTFSLDGAYTVAASLMQVDRAFTRIALDLEFAEGISHCDSDFSLSRSTFAGHIVNREPRDIEPWISEDATEWHFFTEIPDSRRDFTLVHYWFADGRAVGIYELPVEASARWRTWSSLPVSPGAARHIEVFAADRDSGCILGGGHVQLAQDTENTRVLRTPEYFRNITRAFPSINQRPQAALVEFSPGFLAESLNYALADSRYILRFELGELSRLQLSGYLESLADIEYQCQWRDCNVRQECQVDFSRCQRRRETQDCTTCLFRNPLNNRCTSERINHECEFRKARANARYETAWETCMAREEGTRQACERQNLEAVESCVQSGEAYISACERNLEFLSSRQTPLADISGQASTSGGLTLLFNGFRVVGDLTRLKGHLVIEPDLIVEGNLEIFPRDDSGELGQCLGSWSQEFQTGFDRLQAPKRLAALISPDKDGLSVTWPGISVPLKMDRAPLEAVLARSPELLSRCSLGASPEELGQRVGGNAGYFLRGVQPLDIQPGNTIINLPSMTARYGNSAFLAKPGFKDEYLIYDLQKQE